MVVRRDPQLRGGLEKNGRGFLVAMLTPCIVAFYSKPRDESILRRGEFVR